MLVKTKIKSIINIYKGFIQRHLKIIIDNQTNLTGTYFSAN